jgi:uncharacterized membrane protein
MRSSGQMANRNTTNVFKMRDQNMRGIWVLLIAVIGIVVLCIAMFAIMVEFTYGWNRGAAIGESFGALNTVFSGLGLAALLAALLVQMRELRLQRMELEFQRRDLVRQRHESSRQALFLAVGAYVQSRCEARASIPEVEASEQARRRLLLANRMLARLVDRVVEEEALKENSHITCEGSRFGPNHHNEVPDVRNSTG